MTKKIIENRDSIKRHRVTGSKPFFVMSFISPVRVRLQRVGKKIIQDCDVYIGHEWHRNGWKLDKSKWWNAYSDEEYEKRIRDSVLDLGELSGKVLGCWCDLDRPCHGDILIRLWREKVTGFKENPDLGKTLYFPDGKPTTTSKRKSTKDTNTKPAKQVKKNEKKFRNQTTHPEGIRHSGAMLPWPVVEAQGDTIYIDESGMGSYAGPLHVGAVILLPGFNILGLHDSKLLKEHERDAAYTALISDPNIIYHVEIMSNVEIDRLKLGGAWQEAIRRAIITMTDKPGVNITRVILDGNKNVKDTLIPVTPVIRADQLYTGVSAASILAKVSRDRFMTSVAEKYPEFYEIFHKGKGYHYSKLHDELLKSGKYTDLHRLSYNPLRSVVNRQTVIVARDK